MPTPGILREAHHLYIEAELKEWLPRLAAQREKAEVVCVGFNKHYQGQAVANARKIRQLPGSAGI